MASDRIRTSDVLVGDEYECGGMRVRVIGPLYRNRIGECRVSPAEGWTVARGWWVVTAGNGPWRARTSELRRIPPTTPGGRP